MKYIAEVTNTDLVLDLLTVQVVFRSEDNSRIINDSFSTKSGQDENWLTDAITRKCQELEQLDDFVTTIPIGMVDIATANVIEVPAINTDKETYGQNLEKFNKMLSAVRKGIISEDNLEFVGLQNLLKTNFKSEYLNLF